MMIEGPFALGTTTFSLIMMTLCLRMRYNFHKKEGNAYPFTKNLKVFDYVIFTWTVIIVFRLLNLTYTMFSSLGDTNGF